MNRIFTALVVFFILFSGYEILTDDVRILVVLSSSMEPLMYPGDLIIVKKNSEVKVGDVIAFSDPSGKKEVLITHRIIEVEDERIKTKGDAVEDPDPFNVSKKDIYGTFKFGISYIGYLFHEFKSRNFLMYFLFILLPASVLMVSEFKTLTKNDKELRREARLKEIKLRKYRKHFSIWKATIIFAGSLIVVSLLSTPSLTEENGVVTNNGFFDVYVFHETPPYYTVLKPNEKVEIKDFTVINAFLPLLILYPAYKYGILPFIQFVMASIVTFFLKPLYYKTQKKYI